jgi:hypothetical protein
MVAKPRMMGWKGHIACMRAMENVYKILVRKCKGKKPLRSRCSWEDKIKNGFNWPRTETSGRLLRTCNEPSGSIKSRELPDYISDY